MKSNSYDINIRLKKQEVLKKLFPSVHGLPSVHPKINNVFFFSITIYHSIDVAVADRDGRTPEYSRQGPRNS